MSLLHLAEAEMAMENLPFARKHARMALDASRRLYVQKQAASLLEKIENQVRGRKSRQESIRPKL